MAVAVKNEQKQKAAEAQAGLPIVSLVGAVYILLACAAVFYGLPTLWKQSVSPVVTAQLNSFVDVTLRVLAQFAFAVGLIYFWQKITGTKPPVGLRGGIFLAISVLITVFFLTRAVGANLARTSWIKDPIVGLAIMGAVAVGFLVLGVMFLRSKTGRNYATALEHQGWFSVTPYKRMQGLKVRRLTMLGVLIITGAGVWTLMNGSALNSAGDWKVNIPFTNLNNVVLIPDVRFSVPLILIGLSLWFSYRLVHYPAFADFLIATEAEINKVSWSSKRQLVRDTIVVLVTVFAMALFLLVVDIFWGWLLSRSYVGILPGDAKEKFVVVDPGETLLQPNQKLTGEQVSENREKYGDKFTVKPAGEAAAQPDRQVNW